MQVGFKKKRIFFKSFPFPRLSLAWQGPEIDFPQARAMRSLWTRAAREIDIPFWGSTTDLWKKKGRLDRGALFKQG